jgi:hypothetical protein
MSEHSFFSSHAIGEWFLILILLGTLVAGCPTFRSDSFSTNITREKINDSAA